MDWNLKSIPTLVSYILFTAFMVSSVQLYAVIHVKLYIYTGLHTSHHPKFLRHVMYFTIWRLFNQLTFCHSSITTVSAFCQSIFFLLSFSLNPWFCSSCHSKLFSMFHSLFLSASLAQSRFSPSFITSLFYHSISLICRLCAPNRCRVYLCFCVTGCVHQRERERESAKEPQI